MAKMGTIWDRTTEVLSGRGGMLAGIAVPTLLLPTIVRDGYVAYSTPNLTSFAAIGGILSLIVFVVMIWGQLQLIAVASNPATTSATARAQATARLGPAIGVTLLMVLIFLVAAIPFFALIGGSGIDFQAMAAGQPMTPSPDAAGKVGLAILYMVVLLVAALFVGARLAVLNPVILHERRGVGAIARSWRLTAGHTWRLVGVLLLFAIVVGVAATATQSVIGVVLRLALGSDNIATATFVAGIFASIVVTVFTVIAAVFVAQLYVALTGEKDQAAA